MRVEVELVKLSEPAELWDVKRSLRTWGLPKERMELLMVLLATSGSIRLVLTDQMLPGTFPFGVGIVLRSHVGCHASGAATSV